MNYKIVVDSCCDLPDEYRNNPHFQVVPLTIEVGEYKIIDDQTFDQAKLIEKMKSYPNAPKTACPSPQEYMGAYDAGVKDVYVVTLSEKLSGSYNSAVLGKNLLLEDKELNIEVFNSRSASCGEVDIALKIFELAEAGKAFQTICDEVNAFIEGMRTYFVLESLENLRKNGRLSNVQALIANVLNIKPIMGAEKDGSIKKIEQARGINKALVRMTEIVAEDSKNFQDRILSISHCNCYERALFVKDEIIKRCNFKEILILKTAGISSVYAYEGGIIISF